MSRNPFDDKPHTPDAKQRQDPIELEIGRFNAWKTRLTQAVNHYHDWLEGNNQLDIQQSIRFYDLMEHLNRGKLMIAFLAEFSRGKSELINALFFSNFKERLLPSDVGRTTMCPTELFHDPADEPYLKLLSTETRYRDESIAQLKNHPIEWSRIRLNVDSAADMKKALKALAETKKVYALEARMMGFPAPVPDPSKPDADEEMVEIPAWRYAMINFPHPLLSNGLSILDTPGLNALGLEPELTLNTVPNAHAVLFLLSIDTGVTKSDLEIWERYVKPALPMKTAILNKIDLLWDDLKSQDEIAESVARQMEDTAKQLKLDPDKIFPISAQKGLVGKIRNDHEMIKKSGILRLERYLAEQIIPVRRQILAKAVMNEIGAMMMASRASLQQRVAGKQAQIDEINGLAGKSKDVAVKLWQKVNLEKGAYNEALAEYKIAERNFNQKRSSILDSLNNARLDFILDKSHATIESSWTTIGLARAMSEMIRLVSREFEEITAQSEEMKTVIGGVYAVFVEKFGLSELEIAPLDLQPHRSNLGFLVAETNQFCRDPMNVFATEKHFLIKRFYKSLVERAREIYSQARSDVDNWITAVTVPIATRIKDHKSQIESRVNNIKELQDRSGNLESKLQVLSAELGKLREESMMIDQLLAVVRQPFGGVEDPAFAAVIGGAQLSPLDSATSTLTKAVQLLTGRRR